MARGEKGLDGVGIGEKVREERERRGWSARTLAQRAGVSHAYVSHLEAGQYTRPGVEQLRRLAGALGVGVEYLIGEEGREESDQQLQEIQVNLLAIRELDPEALDQLAGIIEAMKEKVERRYRRERRGRDGTPG